MNANEKASGRFIPDRKDDWRLSYKAYIQRQWQFLYAGSQACKKSK